jgi:plastocyanin
MTIRSFTKIIVGVLCFSAIYSCTKTADDFIPEGGLLPTNYVKMSDSTFTPANLIISTGSSVTFVNDSDIEHSIVADDTVTIISNIIAPHTSFFFKKDTVAVIGYHCGVHPGARGTIILRP